MSEAAAEISADTERSSGANRGGILQRSSVVGLAVIALIVVIANALSLTIVDRDPLVSRSGLAIDWPAPRIVPGLVTIDPNDGFTTQALGTAAVDQWLHGEIPLWNHDEGLGEPLAGGMQSAAFFPFVFLLTLPQGVLIMHMVLEFLAGAGTYLLLRRLKLPGTVACVGGVLFALDGTFAWLANAVVNPIAFLPWLVLGIEWLRGTSGRRRLAAVALIAAAMGLSLSAGFPEVAALGALLAGLWFLVRIPGSRGKPGYIIGTIGGVVLGAVVSAPALVAFADYLPDAFLGVHGGGLNSASVPQVGLLALFLPYSLGPLFGLAQVDPSGEMSSFWGNVGGYVTLATAGLALFGVGARRHPLALRIALAAFSVLAIARIYGVPVIGRVFDVIPGMGSIAVYRYLPPALELALTVLACFGLAGLAERPGPVWRRIAAGVFGVASVAVIGVAARFTIRYRAIPHLTLWIAAFALIALIVVLFVVLALLGVRWARAALPGIVVLEAFALFVVPQFSAPLRPVALDTAPVAYLQQHLGDGRYFALGSIQPNYGSYYGIASINENNVPVPTDFQQFIATRLDSQATATSFDGETDPTPGDSTTPKSELLRNLTNYEAAGVSYVVAPKGTFSATELANYRLTPAFADAQTEIVRLPAPAAYASASGCTVHVADRDELHADCTGDAQLVRLELGLPGWHATVDGTAVPIAKHGLYQAVDVPAGQHTVAFRYWPAGMTAALAAGGLGLLVLLALAAVGLVGVVGVRRRVRR